MSFLELIGAGTILWLTIGLALYAFGVTTDVDDIEDEESEAHYFAYVVMMWPFVIIIALTDNKE